MKCAAILLLLLPVGAWAQTDATTLPKRDLSASSNCFVYPPDALAARIQGTVELSLTVTPDGKTKDVVLTKSSGNASLDQRAMTCFAAARYTPATRNGQPTEVQWHEEVHWTINEWNGAPIAQIRFGSDGPHADGTMPPQAVGKPHICSEYYPVDAIQQRIEGTTWIAFTVTAHGATANIHVKVSSGNETLDEAAIFCASTWLYRPAMKNGVPVDVPWEATVKWALH